MALPLIGLVGRKRSGKDTVAAELQRYGYGKAAFADPLRDLMVAIDPLVGVGPLPGDLANPHPRKLSEVLNAVGYEAAKDLFPEVRRVHQTGGTDGIREVLGVKYELRELLGGLDVWEAIAERRIERATRGELLAFTDVRFPSEAALIKRYGGVIVRIARPSLPLDEDAHVSETALDDYPEDHLVVNDGSLADLRVAVDTVIHAIKG
jgi:hypothetical protein